VPKNSNKNCVFSNNYGSIKKRLTKNDVYDGEASVYQNSMVVFSSYDSVKNDYELYSMTDLYGNPEKTRQKVVDFKLYKPKKFQITNKYGFEGDVSFNKDGTMLAYHAYRPVSSADKVKYAQQIARGFVDLKSTEIFVYHFGLGREFQVGI
jgi:hypothetical protein